MPMRKDDVLEVVRADEPGADRDLASGRAEASRRSPRASTVARVARRPPRPRTFALTRTSGDRARGTS